MNTCSISTSWRSELIQDPYKLMETMKATGVNTLELEFRITPGVFEGLRKNLTTWDFKVSSLHAYCPFPSGAGKKAFKSQVTDEDEESRRQAVNQVMITMRNAVEVDASAVVLHCGEAAMEEPIYQMMDFYNKGEIGTQKAERFLDEIVSSRRSSGERSLHALLRSLDEINKEADRLGINVGLENRYYFREMPDMEELETIFKRFEGGRLSYWHDTGHAHVREVLFGLPAKAMLEKFGGRLTGIHLHDAKGYSDHSEPGVGEVDFDLVKGYLKPGAIRVMELSHRVDLDGARNGIKFLRDKGIF